jgi:hypothetical protein
MSNRTAGANRAIREAWQNEQSLVLEGKGTRDWTLAQQEQIKEKGKAYDDQGRAFEGQHMKSYSDYPEYQDDPRNIQLLSRDEHFAAHGRNWQNPTNGYYDPIAKTMTDFGDGPPVPCAEVSLSNPLYADPVETPNERPGRSGAEDVNAPATATPSSKGKIRLLAKSVQRVAVQASKDTRVRRAVGVGAAVIVATVAEVASQSRSSGGGRTNAPSAKSPARMISETIGDALDGARQSPDEHDVSGYFRKNGTYVSGYRRGGKKD